MARAMEPENFLTHTHGWVGCYLADGVDPTAPSVALPPSLLPGGAGVAKGPAFIPAMPGPGVAVPSLMAYLTIAAAYFALGVAVGALVRRLRRLQTAVLAVLVVPGVLAGLGLLAWIVYSLRA
jgi:hypothetical protein